MRLIKEGESEPTDETEVLNDETAAEEDDPNFDKGEFSYLRMT